MFTERIRMLVLGNLNVLEQCETVSTSYEVGISALLGEPCNESEMSATGGRKLAVVHALIVLVLDSRLLRNVIINVDAIGGLVVVGDQSRISFCILDRIFMR